MDKIKLFCLPYAGGSALFFTKWKIYLHHSIELWPLEMAGRGGRYREPLPESLQEVVEDIAGRINHLAGTSVYAIFGHSMGSIIAYELYYKLKQMNLQSPLHLFFSGRKPPHIAHNTKIVHLLPDAEFKAEISKLGGTPPEIFENEELFNIFLPILRADYKMVETYGFTRKESPINCNISILNGKADDQQIDEINEWSGHAAQNCRFYMLEGGHFFIHDNAAKVVSIINNTLLQSA